MKRSSHPSHRALRGLLLTSLISGSLALTTGVAFAASVQDQANLGPRIGEVMPTGATYFGQTFIAGITGPLTQVRLFGCNANNDLTSVQVALYPATGIAPNSTPDTALGALAGTAAFSATGAARSASGRAAFHCSSTMRIRSPVTVCFFWASTAF